MFYVRRTTCNPLLVLLAGIFSLFVPATAAADQASLILYNNIVELAPDLSSSVAEKASKAFSCAGEKGNLSSHKLAIIDYSLPSTQKRFWLLDLHNQRLLLSDLVAHGKNTGENHAISFSNRPGSLQSSLGLFRSGESYIGKHGTSLQLIGLEPGVNDLAMSRNIVIHGAEYVSDNFIRSHQRLGRSFGGPALAPTTAQQVIKYFEESAGLLFAYYPDNDWLKTSTYLNGCS